MIRWPLIRSDFYPVPQYLMCPNGTCGVDDPAHQPSFGVGPDGPILVTEVVRLPINCSCGTRVTNDNAKRLDAF